MTVTDAPGMPGSSPGDAPEADAPRGAQQTRDDHGSQRHGQDGHGSDGHGSDGHGPGSVAEEAALLVELLGSFGSWGGARARPAADAPPADAGADAPTAGQQPGRDCTCGGRTPQACRLCPVCQLVSFVQNVNPETIERVADFATFAASALHEVATAARERATGGSAGGSAHDAPGDPRS